MLVFGSVNAVLDRLALRESSVFCFVVTRVAVCTLCLLFDVHLLSRWQQERRKYLLIRRRINPPRALSLPRAVSDRITIPCVLGWT